MTDLIQTARLVLRSFRPEDAAPLLILAGDRAIADTTISVPHPFTAEHAQAWITEHGQADSLSLHRYFAVVLRSEDALIGVVALRDIDREHAQAELSFWIGRAYWGRGLATEAAAAALRFGFEELGLNRVTAYHMVRNAPSRRVLTRLGFRGEGLLRQRVRKWGVFEDVLAYALLRGEYIAARDSTLNAGSSGAGSGRSVDVEADLSRAIVMGQDMTQEFLSLVAARRGHFQLESGYHAALWLDLDPLFLQPARLRPFVAELAAGLQGYDLAGVCGPLLGGAFLAQTLASSLGVEFFFTERTTPSEPGGLYRVQYGLPPALRDRALGKRIAIVDDVISAGSAVRGSYTELQAWGAQPVVVGALLLLGSVAQRYFEAERVPLKAAVQMDFDAWVPADCPLCAEQVILEDPTALVANRTAEAS